jgi:predicted NAD/FAD-dependent oxidoreductase
MHTYNTIQHLLFFNSAPLNSITIFEIGRGPGGRSSTRGTRALPYLKINHGAPFADIHTTEGRDLISMLPTQPFAGRRGVLDAATGDFMPDENGVYVTGSDGAMSNLAASLIADAPSISLQFQSMIRGLTKSDGRWQLQDKTGETIGSADWLVVAGSGGCNA